MIASDTMMDAAGFDLIFQSFSLPSEIDWIALIKRSENKFQVVKTAGNIPDILVKADILDGSIVDSLVMPVAGNYEIWVKIISFLSLEPLPELQEMIDIVSILFRNSHDIWQNGEKPSLYKKVTRLCEQIVEVRKTEILQAAAVMFAELLDFKRVSLFAYIPEHRVFQGIAGYNARNDRIRRIRERWDKIPFSPLLLASKMPAYLPAAGGINGLPAYYIEQFGLTSLVVTPLLSDNRVVGAALLDYGGEHFETTGETLYASLQFGQNIGCFIERAIREIGITSIQHERPLSPREIEVVQMAAFGESTKQIAARLELSDYTVRDYLTAAAEKLGAKNRTEAVANALRMGLIH